MVVQDHPDFEDGEDFIEDNSDFEDLEYALIRLIYQKGPLDLNQLEEMTEENKNSIDICLKDLENKGIVSCGYVDKPFRDLEREGIASCGYVDKPFRDLEREGIASPRYDDKPFSSGVRIGRCVYDLNPLWRKVYSTAIDSERL